MRITAAAGPLLALVAALLVPGAVTAAECDEEVKVGIVEATGCFTSYTPDGDATPIFETTEGFRMNGFDVEPREGTTVTFSPADDSRGASVDSSGLVDLQAESPTYSAVHFNGLRFSFSPPQSGEMILAESALAQPFMTLTGLTPLSVKQPIRLTEHGAEFDLSFSVGGFFLNLVTGAQRKELAFGVTLEVKDGKYDVEGGHASIKKFELANLLEVDEASLEIAADEIAADVDAKLKGVRFGVIGGFTYGDGKLTSGTLGVSELNRPIGTSGIYLQKLAASVFLAPPFGGAGDIGLTAGPKVRFLGHDIAAVDADGHVEVRGEDVAHKKAAYFQVGGGLKLVTFPIGKANFTYHFGQGTDFGGSVGVGFPSGTNDPGQPTYIGGKFNGWTTTKHFDLEGKASVKVLGLNLLGAKSVLSDRGLAGCAQVVLWVGGGVRWSDGRGELLAGDACNLGRYKQRRSALAGVEGDGATTVKLDGDDRVIRIKAASGEGPPMLTLEHPDGRKLASPAPGDADGVERFKHGAALSDDAGMSAFILPRGSAGRWELIEQPGSPEIESIEVAEKLPPHHVKARITGKGRTRTLRWSSARIPFQHLQFSEVLPNGREVLIHETDDRKGTYRFKPVDGIGSYGRRKLAVDVMQRFNTPRDELVADRYRVRRRPAPPAVRNLRVERRLDDLVVSWRKSRKGHVTHEVAARALGASAAYTAEAEPGRNRVRLRGIGTSGRMRVIVTPRNPQGRAGKPARTTIDTDDIVPNRRRAAGRLVRSARLAAGPAVLLNPVCPEGGSCEIRVRVRRGKRLISSGRLDLPPDMTDRMKLRLPRPIHTRVRKGRNVRGLRLIGTVKQLDGKATRRIQLRG